MSNTKRFVIILIVEFVLLVVGLIKVSIASSNFAIEIPNFKLQYMLGYSLPIISMGLIVFLCCMYILREKKVRMSESS